MEIKILAFISMFLIVISPAFAQNYTCLNANTSSFFMNVPINGNNMTIGPIEEPCKFGCRNETGECYPSPYEVNVTDVGLLFGMIVFALIFFYLSSRFGEKDGASESDLLKIQAFKIYFLMTGLMFLMASQIIMINDVSLMNKTSSLGFIEDMLWFILAAMSIIFVALFVLILKDVANMIAQKKLLRLRW